MFNLGNNQVTRLCRYISSIVLKTLLFINVFHYKYHKSYTDFFLFYQVNNTNFGKMVRKGQWKKFAHSYDQEYSRFVLLDNTSRMNSNLNRGIFGN